MMKLEDIQIGKIYRIQYHKVISYIVPLGFSEILPERYKTIKYIIIDDPECVPISLSSELFFKTYSVELME